MGEDPQKADEKGRIEFLRASIVDVQGTIRALDAKAGWFLALLLLPLLPRSSLPTMLDTLHNQNILVYWMLTLPWMLATTLSFLVLGAISNPAVHIPHDGPTGSFYGGTLFALRWPDLTPWSHSQATKSAEQWMAALPRNPEHEARELAFEQMKLIFVRETKLLRLKWAFRSLLAGLLLFMAYYVWVTRPGG